MELSYFLAQLFGLTMVIFSVIWWLRPKLIDTMLAELRQQPFSMMLAGFFAIVAGLAIVLTHNIWEFSWVGLITLFGWVAILKGVTYIAFPDLLIRTASTVMQGKQRTFMTIFSLLMGLYLTYHGFSFGV
jgi:uncharacterized protein YjeT (DUF2065 family)